MNARSFGWQFSMFQRLVSFDFLITLLSIRCKLINSTEYEVMRWCKKRCTRRIIIEFSAQRDMALLLLGSTYATGRVLDVSNSSDASNDESSQVLIICFKEIATRFRLSNSTVIFVKMASGFLPQDNQLPIAIAQVLLGKPITSSSSNYVWWYFKCFFITAQISQSLLTSLISLQSRRFT